MFKHEILMALDYITCVSTKRKRSGERERKKEMLIWFLLLFVSFFNLKKTN